MSFQDNNGSNGQVTVSLSPDSSIINNSTSSVIILLLRIPFNTDNLMLFGTLRSEEQNINPFGLGTTIDPFGKGMMFPFLDRRGATAGDPSESVNPLGFLFGLQIGSTVLIDPDWSIPQSVTMDLECGLVNNDINNSTQSSLFRDILDLVLVEVIPFTGEVNPTYLALLIGSIIEKGY
jgi:hypothetical protein